MTEPFWQWSLEKVRNEIAAGNVSSVEIVVATLDRIHERRRINAYITVAAENALDEARQLEKEAAAGKLRGPLHGVPVALKDNIATRNVRTTAGSPVRSAWVPEEDADVVARLRAAGAIVLGKNNLFEAAFGAANPEFGETLNPWNTDLSCGGSSSGSAASVADGQAFAALGTDTGGSIRIPAAMCGVVGLKPTKSLLPNRGVVPVSPDLDVVGPITRSVRDAEIVLDGLIGKDPRLTVNHRPTQVVAIPRGLSRMDLSPAVERAMEKGIRRLEGHGYSVREISLPDSSMCHDVMWTIACAEIAEYYSSELVTEAEKFCSPVRLNLLAGSVIPAVDYVKARRVRREITRDLGKAMATVDFVLMPTVTIDAYPSGAQKVEVGGRQMDVLPAIMQFTPLANLSGHPALVVPVDHEGDGPAPTVQLYGRWFEDKAILEAGKILERQFVRHPTELTA